MRMTITITMTMMTITAAESVAARICSLGTLQLLELVGIHFHYHFRTFAQGVTFGTLDTS